MLMKRKSLAPILALLISSFLIPLVVEAQPEPPNVDTLGPVVFFGESGNVAILSPKNSTNYVNPIQLNFTVEAKGMFGQFGNVGVSLDGGVINSVTDFINKSVVQSGPDWYWYQTTVLASVMLPTLSEGTHKATVYYGWQYLGTHPRYEVFAHSTVQFTIDASSPTISGLSILNKTYETDTVPLNFTINEPASQITYSLDGEANFTITGNTTLAGLANGVHNVTVYAKDAVGNVGVSETIAFTIAVPVPEPFPTTLVAVACGASVAVIGIGLLVYFKKRKHQKGMVEVQ
jgi:hypothetical protein